MGVRQRIKDLFSRVGLSQKATTIGGLVPYGGNYRYFNLPGFDDFRYNDRDFIEYLYQAYGRNPHVYSVVNKIGRSYAKMPRAWYADEEGEEKIERLLPPVEQANQLLKRPNWKQSKSDFLLNTAAELLITGNCIIYSLESVGFEGQPAEIFPAITSDVTIQTDTGGEEGRPIRYDITSVGTFDASQVLHLRMPNAIRNTYWGLSPLYAGQAVYTSGNNTFEAAASIHKNRGRTGAIYPKMGDMPLLPEDQDKFQKDWDARTAGAEKFGGIHASPIELGYTGWGLSPSDLKLIEQNIENLRDVCRLYGVPSQLLNDTKSSTYNNVETARIDFYEDVLLPLSEKIDKALGAWLVNMFGGDPTQAYYCASTDKIPILNQPKIELSKKVVEEVKAEILTPEEAKAILYPGL